MLKVDDHDNAILGVCRRFGQEAVLLYDARKVIQNLQDNDGMTFEEACEFFEFNIIGAYVGDGTPAFMEPCEG